MYVSIATVVNKTAVPSMQIIFSLRPLCRKHEINHYEYESGLDFTTLHDNPSTPAAIASTSCTACQLNLSTSHQCCGSGSKLDAYRYLFNNFVDLDPCCEYGSANYIVYNLEKDFFQKKKKGYRYFIFFLKIEYVPVICEKARIRNWIPCGAHFWIRIQIYSI